MSGLSFSNGSYWDLNYDVNEYKGSNFGLHRPGGFVGGMFVMKGSCVPLLNGAARKNFAARDILVAALSFPWKE